MQSKTWKMMIGDGLNSLQLNSRLSTANKMTTTHVIWSYYTSMCYYCLVPQPLLRGTIGLVVFFFSLFLPTDKAVSIQFFLWILWLSSPGPQDPPTTEVDMSTMALPCLAQAAGCFQHFLFGGFQWAVSKILQGAVSKNSCSFYWAVSKGAVSKISFVAVSKEVVSKILAVSREFLFLLLGGFQGGGFLVRCIEGCNHAFFFPHLSQTFHLASLLVDLQLAMVHLWLVHLFKSLQRYGAPNALPHLDFRGPVVSPFLTYGKLHAYPQVGN